MKPTAASHKFIQVRGACQHNLKNIDVDIPRDVMTVITGLSGSGKSSLAFDTIFAEGQRKYVESLSAYARQFLEQMPKPKADGIEGLSPTIAIEQRTTGSNPRSTVATTTEIYDFLRVLFARVGTPTCWHCHREISRQSTATIVDEVLDFPAGTKFMILAPLIRGQKGSHAEILSSIARQGFVRARIDGKVIHLDDLDDINKNRKHNIDVVVDRLTAKENIGSRVADSLEQAMGLADGRVIIAAQDRTGDYSDYPFSCRIACPEHVDVNLDELSPRLFSFNSPHGACLSCHGLGTILEFDADLIVTDSKLTLAAGAIGIWSQAGKRTATKLPAPLREFCDKFEVSPDIPYRNIPADLAKILMHGTSKSEAKKFGARYGGLLPYLRHRWETTDSESIKQKLHGYLSEAACEECNGGRLRPEALAVLVDGKSIAEICKMSVSEAREFFDVLSFEGEHGEVADPILREIRSRLRFMCDVGVEYLSMDRASATLSGGEAQRIRLATQIGNGLVGVCYVLDEPTIGLHQRDSLQLVATLKQLTAMGNTVIVVEHDEETIAQADHVIDMGPGAGEAGGYVVAQGTLTQVLDSEASVTAQYLTGRCEIPVPSERRKPQKDAALVIHEASANNLKGITVQLPLGCFVTVTGVSGSGKSTLVIDILSKTLKRVINGTGSKPGSFKRLAGSALVDRIIEIDQSPIGRTPRSNPATYVGVFDAIRQLYAKTREAKIRGYEPSRFSFNVKGGRCEDCQGQGTRRIEMHFLPDVFVMCGTCRGTRYNRETLEIRYRGMSVADVLDMRVEEAVKFFSNFPKIKQLLRSLMEVGVGYLTLGQPSNTLSGGEAQRIKLAAELGKTPTGHTLYVLDEPTTGLHPADIHNLLNVLNRLVSMGHTVLVIEHNLDVIKMSDWVIDLGPDGGDAGGNLVAAGPPEAIAACPDSHTGRFLAHRLAGSPPIGSPTGT